MVTRPTITEDGYYQMREWQEECFSSLKDAHHWIINAPMASGKSFEICCMIASQLMENESLRAIIAVPQTIIAESFRNNNIEFPNNARGQLDTQESNAPFIRRGNDERVERVPAIQIRL